MHGNATHPTGRSEPFTNLEWFLLTVSLFGMVFNIALGWIGILLFLLPWMVYAACWPRRVIADMSSTLLPWLLPMLALISVLWSFDPDRTLRSGLQMMVTVGIALVVGRRLTVQQIASSFLLVESLAQTAGLISGRTEFIGMTGELAFVGIFGSKNNQALHVGLMLIAAAAVQSDRLQPKLFRMLALVSMVVGLAVLFKARSLGGLLVAFGAMMLFYGVLSLRLFGAYRYLVVTLLGIGAVVGAVLALALGVNSGTLLEGVGKSATLTGRTTLWAYGMDFIARNPLGSGFQAFWRQEFVEAEGLWRLMKVTARAGFHFHNLYVNAGVELGILGMVVVAVALWATWLRSMSRALVSPDSGTAFFAALMTYFLLRSMLEVDAFGAFALPLVLQVIAWATPNTRRLASRLPTAPRAARPGFAPERPFRSGRGARIPGVGPAGQPG